MWNHSARQEREIAVLYTVPRGIQGIVACAPSAVRLLAGRVVQHDVVEARVDCGAPVRSRVAGRRRETHVRAAVADGYRRRARVADGHRGGRRRRWSAGLRARR